MSRVSCPSGYALTNTKKILDTITLTRHFVIPSNIYDILGVKKGEAIKHTSNLTQVNHHRKIQHWKMADFEERLNNFGQEQNAKSISTGWKVINPTRAKCLNMVGRFKTLNPILF